jgi:hypothetical protein
VITIVSSEREDYVTVTSEREGYAPMLQEEREGDTQTSRGFGRELDSTELTEVSRAEREDYTVEPSDE